MRHHVAKLAPVVLASGCSLIYNPSNIGKAPIDASDGPVEIDAETIIDAAIDAPPVFDTNPAALTLETIGPSVIYEGQGLAGSRQALVVIRGHHITPEATVDISPATDLTVGTPIVSANRDFMLVPVTIAINTGMADQLVPLTVTVNQTGASQMLTDKLSLQYLPELATGTTIGAATLAPLYSRVVLTNVTFTGTVAAQVRAVSSIVVGNITANGGNGAGTTGGAGGPGGCGGGNEGVSGGCQGGGGGIGGATSGGGGGGGFGDDGAQAAGGAPGGDATGTRELVTLATNQSGGGGGGAGAAAANGGGGGGGGGTVVLIAGGNIMTGNISANGGNGANGTGVIGATSAGGGGGGSGGAIVIRSVSGTITTGTVTAQGGMAGTPAGGGGGGGAGAVGRIRIDSPAAAPPASTPMAYRGPTFAVSTPTYVTEVRPTLTLFGTSDARLDGFLIDMDNTFRNGHLVDQVIANGTLEVMPTLIYGFNRVCFTLEPAMRPMSATTDPLADSCIDIAYLP